MSEERMTKADLINEIKELRARIVELKRTKEAYQESEEKWHSLAENAPNMIMIVGRDGLIKFINRTPPGFSAEKSIGKNLYDYINPEYRSIARQAIEQVFQTGEPVSYENIAPGPYGRDSWYDTQVGAIKIGEQVVAATLFVNDITERKKAEEALREEKDRTQKYLEIAGVMLLVVNANEIIGLINRRGCEILGCSEDEIVGKNWFDNFIAEPIREEVRGVFRKLMAGKVEPVEYYENPVITKSGEERLIAWHNTILKDEHGNIIGSLSSAVDITECKKAEERLKTSEQKYKDLTEITTDWIWEVDKEGVYTYVSPKVKDLLGYEVSEVLGKTPFDLMPEQESKRIGKIFKEKAANREPFYKLENVNRHKDGHLVTLETNGIPIFDEKGQFKGYRGIDRDITERKKAEEELRQAQAKYRSLVEKVPAITYTAGLDEASTTMYVSPQIEQILGFSQAAFKDDPDIWRKQHHPEDCERVLAEVRRYHEKGESLDCEYRMLTKDGSTVWFRDHARIVKDDEGNPLSLHGVMLDITGRKKAEEKIRQLSSAVEQSIDGIAIGDLGPRLLYVNEAFARMHGYTPEEMIGMKVADLHNQEQMDEYKQGMNKIKTEGFYEGEIEHIKKDRTAFPTYMSVTLLKDNQGKPTGILAVARDITEIKRREQKFNIHREKMVQAEKLASLGVLSAAMAHELTQPLTAIRLSIQNSLVELEKMSCPKTVLLLLEDALSGVVRADSIIRGFRKVARRFPQKRVSKTNVAEVARGVARLFEDSARRAKVDLCLKGMDNLPPVRLNRRELEQLFYVLVENAIEAADKKKKQQLCIIGTRSDEHIELQFSDNCGGIRLELEGIIWLPKD